MKSIKLAIYRKGLENPTILEIATFEGEEICDKRGSSQINRFVQRSIDEAYESGFWDLQDPDGSHITLNMQNIDMVAWQGAELHGKA